MKTLTLDFRFRLSLLCIFLSSIFLSSVERRREMKHSFSSEGKTGATIPLLALGLWPAVFAAECAALEPLRLDVSGLNQLHFTNGRLRCRRVVPAIHPPGGDRVTFLDAHSFFLLLKMHLPTK